jgi:hypothetical protein
MQYGEPTCFFLNSTRIGDVIDGDSVHFFRHVEFMQKHPQDVMVVLLGVE